ncbi:MAG TPA: outer membrane protein assembly factor BamD [Phycisphaerae bacterium]|nr:outer membrane protein assembly factor BamD [Phycisphaerae bacterium]
MKTMRTLWIGAVLLGVIVLAADVASARWVWRNGRWEYVEDTWPESPPPATPDTGEGDRPQSGRLEQPPSERAEPAPPAQPPPKEEPPPPPKEEPAPEPPEAPSEMPVEAPPQPTAEEIAAEAEARARAGAQRPWYARWRRPPDPSADRTLFEAGRAAFEAGDHGKAARTLKNLIKKHPDSAYRPEAMWLRGEALFAAKDYYKAYEQYENLLRDYAGSPRYRRALEREMEIAELYLGPVRRRVWGMPLLSGETEAIEILRRVYEHQPAGDLAERCLVRIADYHYEKHRWPEAEDYYDRYCKEFPNGGRVVHAELARAKCAIERCRGARYDTASLALAHDRLSRFQQKYPDVAETEGVPGLLEELRGLNAEALYNVAAYYRRAGKPLAAVHYAEQAVAQYGDTAWGEQAKTLIEDLRLLKEPSP